MTALCPACWRVVPLEARRCPYCRADIERLHQRDFRDKLLAALAHPIADTVVRAAFVLAGRRDPEASRAIDAAMQRFSNEPHVLAGLLDALAAVGDAHAKRIASKALGHRSVIVRRAAARVLARIDRRDSEATGRDRER